MKPLLDNQRKFLQWFGDIHLDSRTDGMIGTALKDGVYSNYYAQIFNHWRTQYKEEYLKYLKEEERILEIFKSKV